MSLDDVIKRYFEYIDIYNNTPFCNFENENIKSITIKEIQSHYDEIKIFSLQGLLYKAYLILILLVCHLEKLYLKKFNQI